MKIKVKDLMKSTWSRDYRPNDSFSEDHVEIYVIFRHGFDLQKFFRGHLYKYWDGFQQDEYLKRAGLNDEEITRINKTSAEKLMLELKRNIQGLELYFGLHDDYWVEFYRVSGSKEEINKTLRLWFEEAKENIYWASGDDSYFDYTPDEVDLFYQICCATGNQELWNEFINWAVQKWYNDPGDCPIDSYFEIEEE